MNFRTTVGALAAMLLFSGCTTTITNLTPSNLPRSRDNLYPFEVALETSQTTLREDSIKAFVVIGEDLFPMRGVDKLKNRWETAVVVPGGTNYAYYRYKFEYDFDKMASGKGRSSRLSPTYKLEIVDK